MAHDSSPDTLIKKHKQAIDDMTEKYSVGLDGPANGVLPTSRMIEPSVVLLTGTTGGLGSVLLSELLKLPAVQRVYAFNRPSPGKTVKERQELAFREKGLLVDLLNSSKLVYVEADAFLDKCGLSPAQYEEIRGSVTMLIHCAWNSNYRMELSSFEDIIRGTRNLLNLCLDSPHRENIRFFFTSSIFAVQAWDNSNGPVPEEVLFNSTVGVGMGYGESKYVTEQIIAKSGIHATTLRIHQISGRSWSTSDWFPILVKSSVALGALPTPSGVASWLREEDVVLAILEIAFADEAPPPVLHIANPRGARFADLIMSVRRAFIKHKILLGEDDYHLIPFKDWLELLEQKAENPSKDDLMRIPGIKLLAFLRMVEYWEQQGVQRVLSGAQHKSEYDTTEVIGLPNFSTTKARHLSSTLNNMQAIGDVEVDDWVRYWMSIGFLSGPESPHSNRSRL